jgi:hypothetical protein
MYMSGNKSLCENLKKRALEFFSRLFGDEPSLFMVKRIPAQAQVEVIKIPGPNPSKFPLQVKYNNTAK